MSEDTLVSYFSSTSVTMRAADEVLVEYMDVMVPGKSISAEDILKQQAGLYLVFKVVLNQEQEQAFVALDELLEAIKKNINGAFLPKMISRGEDDLPITLVQLNEFKMLCSLFIWTCNPETRERNLRVVSLDYVSDMTVNPNVFDTLKAFFKL